MDFKPSVPKTSISVLCGILINYILAVGMVTVECMCAEGVPCYCPQPAWLEHAFDPVPVIFSILTMFVINIVWSFIQKK
ncbi:hypothetical protein ACFLTH_14560 [Bacteroidota bacterium]